MVSLIDLCWFFPVTGHYFPRESYCFDLEKTRPRYIYFSYMEPPGSKFQGMRWKCVRGFIESMQDRGLVCAP